MQSIKETKLYEEVVKELNYKFGNVYIFQGFVISEINEGVNFSWENHASLMINDITDITKSNGSDLVYISHKLYSYSVVPTDWLKFFNNSFDLKEYAIVGYSGIGFINTIIENLFFKKKIQRFSSINEAVDWARNKDLIES